MPKGRARAQAAAVALPAQKKDTIAAHDEQARALVEQRKLTREAAVWAFDHGVGSKAACKQEQFRGMPTYTMVEPLRKKLQNAGSIDVVRDHARQILTNVERCQLAE